MPSRRSRVTLAIALFAGLIVAGCAAPQGTDGGSALQGRIVVTGSSTVAPLTGEIAKRFEARHRGVRVDVQTGGSSRGIADVVVARLASG